jgi:exonuclease VII small subunit
MALKGTLAVFVRGTTSKPMRCLLVRQRIVDVFERQQLLRKRIGKIRDSLPYVVMDRLHHMTKSGDRNVRLEFRHVERDEDRQGKVVDVVRWRPDIVATVAAPHALEVSSIEEIGDKLRSALTACNNGEANLERTERELRHWAESIEAVDRCEAELEEVESALSVFIDPSNLRGLCWVCRKDADQTKAARAALRAAGARDDAAGAGRALDAWRDELKVSGGPRTP